MKIRQRDRSVDERSLGVLIEESQDLHLDAMVEARQGLDDFHDLANDRRRSGDSSDPAKLHEVASSRDALTSKLGLAVGGLVGGGVLAAAFSSNAFADDGDVDTMILQTATSLELLAVATYQAALTLPFIADGNAVVKKFAEVTMMQHAEHRAAFASRTTALGGTEQKNPNPKYGPIVEQAKPTLATPADVVKLAATLEQVATETYLADLNMFTDVNSRVLMASVMGVECQHLATLRAVGALLDGGAPELIAIPTDLAALPAAAGSVAFPDAFQGVTMASPPNEGAVQ